MKCKNCSLLVVNNNGSKSCKVFGSSWSSRFQYENKHGDTTGCYLDKHYIDNYDKNNDYSNSVIDRYFDGEFDEEDNRLE